jgi:CheY-like chemotaxis protein
VTRTWPSGQVTVGSFWALVGTQESDAGPVGGPTIGWAYRLVGWPTLDISWTATNTSVIRKSGERPSTMCVKVLLADDTAVMRKGIRSVLGHESEIEVVAEAENFAQSLSMTREFKPHVVILDLHMPDSSNLTPTNVSEGRAYAAAVLAICVWNDEDTRALAQSYGAKALLDKMHLGQEFIPAVMKLGSDGGSSPSFTRAQASHD